MTSAKRKSTKKLVIDASVARASGSKGATAPEAISSRDFLQSVLTICHRMILTPEIKAEWDTHQSNFARSWRVSMNARRKIDVISGPPDHDLRIRIEKAAEGESALTIVSKDIHLVEAAIKADHLVVALDERARRHLKEISKKVAQLKRIIWINPCNVRAELLVDLTALRKSRLDV